MFSQTCGCGSKLKIDNVGFTPEQIMDMAERWLVSHNCAVEVSLDPKDSFTMFQTPEPDFPLIMFVGGEEDDEEE